MGFNSAFKGLKATCTSRTSDIRQTRSVHPWYTTFRITRFWVTARRVLKFKNVFCVNMK